MTHATDRLVAAVADRLADTGCLPELAMLELLAPAEVAVLVRLEAWGVPETFQARLRVVA